MRSPIIIGTAEVLLPYGGLELIGPALINYARRASVPVVVHYDHGLTFEKCLTALKLGFTSVMFDGSAKEYGENIAQTREIVKIAHALGGTVEGEIGHVGDAQEDADTAGYTTRQEAVQYIADTGVDALAIAIGTAHGAYKKKPRLDFERLREIREATDTPLVLHGGSGLSDQDFVTAVKNGIAKVNIFTDLCLAGERAVREALKGETGYLEMRNKKVLEIKEEIKKKIRLFGSEGRA